MMPPNDRTCAYEWFCDHCRGRNTQDDLVCWFCGTCFLDGSGALPDGVHVPRSARSDADIVGSIVDHMTFDTRHISRPAALHAVTRRLAEQYGPQLTNRALVKYRRDLERQKRGLERQLAEQEALRKKGL
jgi:hypothetical protein